MSPPPILAVEQITKTFGDVRAVDGISFEVGPGEILGFLGPNGAGKTTTLRMILEITRPDAGRVVWGDGGGLDRRRIGYLPEERGVFEDAGVLAMLAYLGTLRGMDDRAAQAAAAAWLERLGLADRARHKVGTLSKGNQQKVQFAGAILHRPALAVLDEPFSGLDPINQELVIGLIRELRDQGVAVLLSAHQLNLAERLCDRFYLIARGRGVLEGTLERIRTQVARGAGEVLEVDLRPVASASDGRPDELVRSEERRGGHRRSIGAHSIVLLAVPGV
jgi:ABC-2 type transport system ATP-binding protein